MRCHTDVHTQSDLLTSNSVHGCRTLCSCVSASLTCFRVICIVHFTHLSLSHDADSRRGTVTVCLHLFSVQVSLIVAVNMQHWTSPQWLLFCILSVKPSPVLQASRLEKQSSMPESDYDNTFNESEDDSG